MWLLPVPQHPVIQMLTRFEDESFIHVVTHGYLQPHASTGATANGCSADSDVAFTFPRYRLTFKLSPRSTTLQCMEYSGYFIPNCDPGAPALPLPWFESFLLLQSAEATMPPKVLIPYGNVLRPEHGLNGTIQTPHDVDRSDLAHHTYTFNRRTLGLDTTVIHSRLFLAAVYAATHCDVPLPQLGMTGGEHALQLLRQSWVNRPLSEQEAGVLQAVERLSVHTPAAQLLCHGLSKDARSFLPLYGAPGQASQPADDSRRDSTRRDACFMYAQDARRTHPLPFVHVRRQLAAGEEHLLFHQGRSLDQVRVPRTLRWPAVLNMPNADNELYGIFEMKNLFEALPEVLSPLGGAVPAAEDRQHESIDQGSQF